jgi:SAM-dependent methyltransferase
VTNRASPRLAAIVAALPLEPDSRVLEIGCGPGVAARAVAERVPRGYVLAIDRSARAIGQAARGSGAWLDRGRLELRHVAIEDLVLGDDEAPFDVAFAVRVGALDGRHPEDGERALARVRAALAPHGRLFVDGGNPLVEILLPR